MPLVSGLKSGLCVYVCLLNIYIVLHSGKHLVVLCSFEQVAQLQRSMDACACHISCKDKSL